MNDGLSSLIINQITYNPWMSAMVLFCATDSGAYMTFDIVGLDDWSPVTSALDDVRVFPVPAKDLLMVTTNLSDNAPDWKMELHDMSGKAWGINHFSAKANIQISLDGIPAGTYLLTGQNGNKHFRKKIIVR
jgi:hypothetical protein